MNLNVMSSSKCVIGTRRGRSQQRTRSALVSTDGKGYCSTPDEPTLWQDIGYQVVHGYLAAGARVVLERAPHRPFPYFPRLLTKENSVALNVFEDEYAQDVWIADQIAVDLTADELEPDDVLIVLQTRTGLRLGTATRP